MTVDIHATAIVHDEVDLGANARIGAFCVVGEPVRGEDGLLPLVIGEGSTIRSHSILYGGSTIGSGFATGHGAQVRERCIIGDRVSVGSKTVIEHHVTIGDSVRIHSQAFVPEFSVLEDGCWLGPNVVLTNARYPVSRNVKNELIGPTVKKGAKIGANSTLLPGVVVGENALVGAGSVVVRDVAPGTVVAGNPAKMIGNVADLPNDPYQTRTRIS